MAALVFFGAGHARADWTASWSLGAGQGPTFTSGNSSVLVTPFGSDASGSDIKAATLSSVSSSLSADAFNTPFDLSVTIKDTSTGATGSLTWHGQLTGSISPSGGNLQASFTSPLKQTALNINGNDYAFTLTSPVNIPDPASSNTGAQGLIDAEVKVSPSSGNPPPTNQTPEPSSLVLAGSALSLAALAAWRRRRGLAVVGV
jgi:MYXO-CTERM domain-containing protein